MQGSYLYIGAIFFAFILYHLDSRYSLNDQLSNVLDFLSSVLLFSPQKFLENPAELGGYLLILTLAVVSLILAVKKVQ
jgi:hypothetical protein